MFGTLIESRAARQKRTGSSVASVVAHVAIIGSAVAATATQEKRPDPPPQVVIVDYVPPVVPPPEPMATSNPMRDATVIAAPKSVVLQTPSFVPTEIPPIDLNAAPTPVDFTARRIVGASVLCDRDCPRSGVGVDSAGRDSRTANDVMMRMREAPVPPRYPETLRRAGIEGEVVVKFVVDTTGRVDMGSVEVVRATHDAFVIAVRESLAKLRFNPSMVGERKVPALAMMPFHFTLR
jgi:protein TonB